MKINSLNNWLVVGVFGVMLILPGVQMLTRVVPEPEIEENRKLMTMPTWGVRIKDWSKQFESYFNDNFGFRNLLVSWNGKLGADVIGVSNVPAVLVGKEGWLYFKAEEAQEGYKFQTYTLQDYEGKVPFTLKELTELNKRWKEISQRLKEKNIELVLVIVPDKQTIYPEYLKGVYPGKGLTRREQIYQELAKNSDIDLVDLKPGLIKMKPIAPAAT